MKSLILSLFGYNTKTREGIASATVRPAFKTTMPNGMTFEQWQKEMNATDKHCPAFTNWCAKFSVSGNYSRHENTYSHVAIS
jgi:hypothetical protein